MKRVKSKVTYLQYITDTRSGQKIIIPDSEMQRFIAVTGTYNDHLLYFQPDEVNLSKGTKVRIIGGDFEGQEGVFQKVKMVHVTVVWSSKYRVSLPLLWLPSIGSYRNNQIIDSYHLIADKS